MKTTTRTVSPRQADADHLERIWKLAYTATTTEDLEQLYAEWASSYDQDHANIGFIGHRVAANALQRHTTRHDLLRVLDAGAGTGAAGQELQRLGFAHLTGVDLSPHMLAVAREKACYEELVVADMSLPVDALPGLYFDAAIAVGLFSYGQAPAETLDEILRVVRPGGVIALTMRTDFFEEDPLGIRARLELLQKQRICRLLDVTEPLPYLPGKDPRAMFRVWCFRVIGRRDAEAEDGFEEAVREAFEDVNWVKKLDHSWIWDSRASRLYERYSQSDGYYLTDSEEEIIEREAHEIVASERLIVELGCGSARKIRHILKAALEISDEPLRYCPIDVSKGALDATTEEVRRLFSERLEVCPQQGLFADILDQIPEDQPKLVFFFGSSIGNLDRVQDTVRFLEELRAHFQPGDRLVLGIDLHKDADVLERAYNEEEACRDFFVHMVRRINETLGSDFDPRVFQLSSTYEPEEAYQDIRTHRMNLRVAPTEPQRTWVKQLGMEVSLEAGQPVQVGISRKFDPESIGRLAQAAGFHLRRQYFDARRWFSLSELVSPDV